MATATTTTHLRHEGVGAHGWIVAAFGMLGLALGSGYALALGEVAGLYIGLSLVFAVAVLFDFRVGAVLLLLILPVSASALFPRGLMGVSGLNPLNLLVLATVASYFVSGRLQSAAPLVPKQLVWLFAVPILVGGLIGMGHVHEIPSFFYELEVITYFTQAQYLMFAVVKPFAIVAVGVMIGAAAARAAKPERFIVAIGLSAWMIALVQIGFVLSQGVPLVEMATPGAREFYEPIGLHANTLGRLHMFAIALLLFVWVDSKSPGMRAFLVATLVILSIALVLTFSRASVLGALIVGALFLMWKFNARTLSIALLGLLLLAVLGGDLLLARLMHGVGEGADELSAGRIDGIWLPLLPELAKNPVFGNGLNSILWSFPMVTESMHRVGHPHNAYLQAVLDMGLVGAGLLMAYYAHVWKGFRALGKADWLTPELRGLFQGAAAGLAAFFVTCLVGSSLRAEPEWAYLWIAIGLMYGLRSRRPAA